MNKEPKDLQAFKIGRLDDIAIKNCKMLTNHKIMGPLFYGPTIYGSLYHTIFKDTDLWLNKTEEYRAEVDRKLYRLYVLFAKHVPDTIYIITQDEKVIYASLSPQFQSAFNAWRVYTGIADVGYNVQFSRREYASENPFAKQWTKLNNEWQSSFIKITNSISSLLPTINQ